MFWCNKMVPNKSIGDPRWVQVPPMHEIPLGQPLVYKTSSQSRLTGLKWQLSTFSGAGSLMQPAWGYQAGRLTCLISQQIFKVCTFGPWSFVTWFWASKLPFQPPNLIFKGLGTFTNLVKSLTNLVTTHKAIEFNVDAFNPSNTNLIITFSYDNETLWNFNHIF